MAAKTKSGKPQLHLVAAAWSMTNYPSAEKQWSWAKKVKAAKDAGFVGVSAGATPELVQALREHKMALIGGVDVGEPGEAEPKLRAFKEAGAVPHQCAVVRP